MRIVGHNGAMHTVTAGGDPRSIGHGHGEATRLQIRALLDVWRREAALAGHDLDPLIHTIAHESGFLATTRRWLPDLVEEVEGLAVGAGISAAEAFALNCMDEAWWLGSTAGGGCSVIAVVDHVDVSVVGQNMDLDSWMDGSQVALRVQPKGRPRQVLLSRAGMVGLCGANDAGLAVMVNTLAQLPTDRDGVPVAFVVRALLSQPSLEAAVELVQRLPHASGQAYTLASPEGVRGFECGGGVVREYRNDVTLPKRRWHTNHPIADGTPPPTHGSDDRANGSTAARMSRLDESVAAVSGPADVQALLSDSATGICMVPGRSGDDGITFASVVVTLPDSTGGTPDVLIAPGPPDRTPFVPVPFA